MAIPFPDSLLVSQARPLDDKFIKLSIAERDALPISLRYKGYVVGVQNGIGQKTTYWALLTDDLGNDAWEEVILTKVQIEEIVQNEIENVSLVFGTF